MPTYWLESKEDVLTFNGKKKKAGIRATGRYKHLFLYAVDLEESPDEILAR